MKWITVKMWQQTRDMLRRTYALTGESQASIMHELVSANLKQIQGQREMHPDDIAEISRLTEQKYAWASIINRLAHIALDGAGSNDRDYAQDMIDMVRPLLGPVDE